MNWIGMPNPLLWASAAALLNFIPYIGPIIITGLLLLAGIVSFSATAPGLVIMPALAFLALHAVESNLVSPWFIGRRLSLSRLAVFLSVMFWGWMWGIAGAVTAVPVLIGLRAVCRRKRSLRHLCVYLDGNGVAPPSLRGVLRARGRPRPSAPPPAAL
jgi:predicted PurR-regulated permease PerM